MAGKSVTEILDELEERIKFDDWSEGNRKVVDELFNSPNDRELTDEEAERYRGCC